MHISASIKGQRDSDYPRPPRKFKKKPLKMRLKAKLRDWLFEENNKPDNFEDRYPSIEPKSIGGSGVQLESKFVQFRLHRAQGGFAVELSHYDAIKDRNINSLYLIKDGDNLGAELEKIIMIENLSH